MREIDCALAEMVKKHKAGRTKHRTKLGLCTDEHSCNFNGHHEHKINRIETHPLSPLSKDLYILFVKFKSRKPAFELHHVTL